MADIERVTGIAKDEAQALGFDLVRVRLFGARPAKGDDDGDDRTLQIMAERPDTRQLTIDDCGTLSRAISDRLDALEEAGQDPIPGSYRLEVSSPGIDRPLTRLADFSDWAGHEARVTLIDAVLSDTGERKNLHGIIDGVELGTIAFTDRKGGAVRFTLENIANAKLLLTDRLIAATRPLDTSGVDETVEEAGIESEYLSSEQDQ
ncbi:ribosome maturation factor [Novosphingobium sp. Gsoil 351]|uniref:ribosome maturation factor n=1 Tax=Novosphingobium sp. Gsoil 351 TaxID=2675225 RepID=UPI0012B470BF|nr:ribosome maturation factor [Novosphingobium sp. Gsoil 351]QGN55417.1 ribosome maturation factor [Novosphingobium sp. Gsoil 351]